MARTKHPYNWEALNDRLRECKDEGALLHMLQEERSNNNRRAWLRRIHARLNRVRVQRERKRLGIAEEPERSLLCWGCLVKLYGDCEALDRIEWLGLSREDLADCCTRCMPEPASDA